MKRILPIIVLAAFLVLPAAAGAAGPKDVKFPPFSEHELKNGMRVFIVETREVPMVTIRLLVPSGSSLDPAGKEGLADLTATMLMKGADGAGAEDLAEAIESVGGSMNSGSNMDATQVFGDFMAKDLDLALELMASMVLKPDFPPDEFEREKGIVMAGLISAKENPSGLAWKVFLKKLLGSHPYSNPVEGYVGSVESLVRDDVVAFHADNYVPQGAILAIVGDVESKKALSAVKKRFGGWKGSRVEKSGAVQVMPVRFEGRRVVVIDKPDATQSQIRIGNIGVGRKTPDFFPLEVANTMLGGGFTSRLMEEIRVNRGLSYGARSRMSKFLNGGYFGVSTFTKNESLRETIDVALAEVAKMGDIEVTSEELEGTERYISGLFPFELETNADIASWMVILEFYGLDKEFVETYRTRIDEVTSSDVQRVARKYFHTDDNLIVLLTNYAETASQLEGLGEIEVISVDEID